MTLKQLEVFLAVADTRSFSKGAEVVSLAQSTVSQHIRALEDELGARLFDRSATKASLTEVGRLFYEHASLICRLSSESQSLVKRFQGLEQAALKIGASTIPAACLIPDLLGSFSAAWPGVKLEVLQGDSGEVIRLLQDESVELAVLGGQFESDGVSYQQLGMEQIILVARPGAAPETVVTMRELQEMPLLLREPGSGTRQAVESALLKAGCDPRNLRAVAWLGSSEALRRAALGGAGCAFLSSLAVGRELEDGSLKKIEVEGLSVTRYFYLARRRGRTLSAAAEAFVETIVRNMP